MGGESVRVRLANASTTWYPSWARQLGEDSEMGGTCARYCLRNRGNRAGFERRAQTRIIPRGLGRIGWDLRPL